MQTCTPEWRTSFLRKATPALSNVSLDIGVLWRQGKTTDSRKIATSTVKRKAKKKNNNNNNKKKTKNKKKNTNQITFEKKKFYFNSTEM